MDYKNKSDDELVSDGWKTISGRTNSIEMMRRLKDSIEKLNKSTEKFNNAQIALTLILLFVAIMQIVVTVSLGGFTWKNAFIGIFILLSIWYLAEKILRLLNINKK